MDLLKRVMSSLKPAALPVKIYQDRNDERAWLRVFFDQSPDEGNARHVASIVIEALHLYDFNPSGPKISYTVFLEPKHNTMVLRQVLSFADFNTDTFYARREKQVPSRIKKRLTTMSGENFDLMDFFESGISKSLEIADDYSKCVRPYLPGDTPIQSMDAINKLQETGFLTDASRDCLHEVIAAFESAQQQQRPVNVKTLKTRLEALLPRIAAVSRER